MSLWLCALQYKPLWTMENRTSDLRKRNDLEDCISPTPGMDEYTSTSPLNMTVKITDNPSNNTLCDESVTVDMNQPKLENPECPEQYEEQHQHHMRKSKQKGSAESISGYTTKTIARSIAVIPKVEKISPLNFLFLSLMCIIPGAIYIFFFTQMGHGLTTYFKLSEDYGQNSSKLFGVISIAIIVLYFLDIDSWDSNIGKVFRYIFSTTILFFMCIWVLFITEKKPSAPLTVYAILMPVWFYLIWNVFYFKRSFRRFVSWLSGPLLVTSCLPTISWIIWISYSEQNRWNTTTRIRNAFETGCEPNFGEDNEYNDLSYCRKGYDDSDAVCFSIEENIFVYDEGCDKECLKVFDSCKNTLIVWIGPLFVGLGMFFMSFFASFIKSESPVQDMKNFLKLWIFLMTIFWITVSLNGLSNLTFQALTGFTFTMFIVSTLFLAGTFTPDGLKSQNERIWESLHEKYGKYFDIGRGLVVVTCLPALVIYACLSVINQTIRKVGCLPCSKKLTAEDRGWFTKRTRKQYGYIKKWNRVKVLTYGIYWGIGYISMSVIGAKFSVLFLGWVISYIQDSGFNLFYVTAAMFVVGWVMFLIPVVPGAPIYLALGIVIPAIAKNSWGNVASISYCSAVSLFLKLFACFCQQKLIGERFSSFVVIRQLVNINSDFMRAVRVILSDPGLSIAKVSILVGGPDWPTSVTAGLLRVNVLPVAIGTLPVVVLIVPSIISGTLLYISSQVDDDGSNKYPWAISVAALCVAVVVGIQFCFTISAAIFIERSMTTRKDEIDLLPIDEEVLQREASEEHKNKLYAEVTLWRAVPFWAKSTLLLSLISMTGSCYIVTFLGNLCFMKFEITDTIEDALDGDWLNFILPLGRLSLLMFVVSLILYTVFYLWSQRATKRRLFENPPPRTDDSVFEQVQLQP